ncbi:hypothetical protein HOO65_030491 [Ceratocystis lukuohia]|uniref:Uncharacterized protein n=1 Tax=Ceratocystis lukuohia TaxID=2019550 RepID=A0ABR4ML45_9PEZI
MASRTSPPIANTTDNAPRDTPREKQDMFSDLPKLTTRTPEPRLDQTVNGAGSGDYGATIPSSPNTPGNLPAFDWEEFGARYERALADADAKEREILEEFDRVAKYFGVWASTSSSVDNDRATKRLQTRERFVSLSEKRTAEKQDHHVKNGAIIYSQRVSHSGNFLDLKRFHDDFFSPASLAAFGANFFPAKLQTGDISARTSNTNTQNEDECTNPGDDYEDLGCYPDGNQRTLTDEQVYMFRQSELKEMLKNWQKRKAIAEKNSVEVVFSVSDPRQDKQESKASIKTSDLPDADEDISDASTPSWGKKRKKTKNSALGLRKEPKPDLRKRTWDVVDTGLDSLEYD